MKGALWLGRRRRLELTPMPSHLEDTQAAASRPPSKALVSPKLEAAAIQNCNAVDAQGLRDFCNHAEPPARRSPCSHTAASTGFIRRGTTCSKPFS